MATSPSTGDQLELYGAHIMTFAGLFISASGLVFMTLASIAVVRCRIRDYKYWAFLAVAIGMFDPVMDHGNVNVALPSRGLTSAPHSRKAHR